LNVSSSDVHATDSLEARVRILETPLSVDACIEAVRRPTAGAIVVMIGLVRDHALHDDARVAVTRLEYEAYVPMAEQVMTGIVREVEVAGVRACVHHRVGSLAVGDVAVVVVVSAPHRHEAFEACRRVIDRLKEDAPIWKREHGSDGVAWVGLGP
jgi:molybdopterin synthase catalytic subunit